jgi:hypothetical protein
MIDCLADYMRKVEQRLDPREKGWEHFIYSRRSPQDKFGGSPDMAGADSNGTPSNGSASKPTRRVTSKSWKTDTLWGVMIAITVVVAIWQSIDNRGTPHTSPCKRRRLQSGNGQSGNELQSNRVLC